MRLFKILSLLIAVSVIILAFGLHVLSQPCWKEWNYYQDLRPVWSMASEFNSCAADSDCVAVGGWSGNILPARSDCGYLADLHLVNKSRAEEYAARVKSAWANDPRDHQSAAWYCRYRKKPAIINPNGGGTCGPWVGKCKTEKCVWSQ